MIKSNIKKLFSVLVVLALVMTAVLGTLAACKDKPQEHVCKHVCEECGLCKDADCADPKCAQKCQGHKQEEPPVEETKTYFVAPNAKVSGADGSKENPYNIGVLLHDNGSASKNILKAGDVVYVMPGYYKLSERIIMSASGAHNKNIKIINAAYDKNSDYNGQDKRAVLDFSEMEFSGSNRGVQIYGDYVYWYGIDVCGAGDNGMYIAGSYNTVEYCEFYNNRDTGLQIGRASSEQLTVNEWPSYNLVKNCTSHNNYDNQTYGENADGFAAKLTVGYGNVFDGCIAYRNSDDGWDLYAKSESGNIGAVIMYNCVAYENGYLEYTQQQFNKLFPAWDKTYSESPSSDYGLPSFTTRDGDGNGFKLGGSVMEGDVVMYNCLSYGNKMHGVTDNSNPGVITLTGVTGYNNSAAVDNNPASERFGQIIDASNGDNHGNIDLARQTYSYNTLDRVLSVMDSISKSLDADAYRGSVANSLLCNGSSSTKWNAIVGTIDADTANGGKTYTEQKNGLVASDIFTTLPVVKGTDGVYTYNLSGLKDLGVYAEDGTLTLNANRAHVKFRNADGSINMGGILAVKDYTKLLGDDNKIGSVLNLTSYAAYTHFADEKLAGNAESEIAAVLAKTKESLTIGVDVNACYQDFDVLSKMIDCFVSWSSSNKQLVKLNEQYDVSLSTTEYVRVEVTRPTDKDTKVTLTATISYLNQSVTKDFEMTVKKDAPTVGDIYVTVAETGEVINNNGRLIVDINRQYAEPQVSVKNGAYYNGTLLTNSQYNLTTIYKYAQTDSNADKDFVEINGYTPNVAGVYKITHTVALKDDAASSKTFTYKVYVASTSALVDFVDGAELTVNRDGYIISGALNSVTGTLYAVSSTTPLELTADTIKTAEGVKSYDFRDTSVSFQFENANNAAYNVYYALANVNGDVTSEVYCTEVKTAEITGTDDFMKVAGGVALNGENPSATIYTLTKCLDFTGINYAVGSEAFRGLLNGQGHTVSNITVTSSTNSKAAVFYSVKGGTIENIKFDNIVLSGAQRVGIIAEVRGGYFSNIAVTNVSSSGAQRVGGLIGQIYEGAIPTYVDRVSVINPLPTVNPDGTIPVNVPETTAEGDAEPQPTSTYEWKYSVRSTGNRAGGIIGFIQPSGSGLVNDVKVYVSNCYASTYVYCKGYSTAGIVAEFDDTYAPTTEREFRLEIRDCLSDCILVNTGTSRIGGMLGYQHSTGILRINSCLSIGRHFYKNEEVLTCQKNASGIMGNYNLNADAIVANCYSIMQEHNSNYNVQANPRSFYTLQTPYIYLGWDMDSTWTLVDGEIATLNFAGEWNCNCAAQAD